ncbi:uncharacterized protein K452DRAFT_292341 [Aplosporella prunicola CBS 121167]|uniref:AB hydrolase-1 domain-containing protein n=1 Tax=Aplosporella prunicola CBS 121167 TaxID=1176127 RepID=A0A6A6AZ76_9PEZI|nr:uncharacterized protein K452DRAFT_292341 [Aplosporella prunicola CBS 121167]KAF2136493.1 hypothetical protein K452DRAFT_292341 [Aplosporella prunicola CBS 121167]
MSQLIKRQSSQAQAEPPALEPRQAQARIATLARANIRIHFIDQHPPEGTEQKGVMLLIHGFPQTSYQFRHVTGPLAAAGYRSIAADYRGAGRSSHPHGDFTKVTMAADLAELVHEHLGVTERVHVVGHDIGAMVAHAYAARLPGRVQSVALGECPLPGTAAYERDKRMPAQFHFVFHSVGDLPEALTAGRERIYLRHFFDKLAYNALAIPDTALDHYARDYEQPGAMRCAFGLYRYFEADAHDNADCRRRNGKCRVPALALSGEFSRHAADAQDMLREMYESVDVAEVRASGHYVAEENPADFVDKLLAFVRRNSW